MNSEINTETAFLLCRLCLNESETLHDIFTSVLSNHTVAAAIMACVPIQIAYNDGLPTTVCTTCYQKLLNAHEFRDTCIQSDKILRQSIQQYGLPIEIHIYNNLSSSKDSVILDTDIINQSVIVQTGSGEQHINVNLEEISLQNTSETVLHKHIQLTDERTAADSENSIAVDNNFGANTRHYAEDEIGEAVISQSPVLKENSENLENEISAYDVSNVKEAHTSDTATNTSSSVKNVPVSKLEVCHTKDSYRYRLGRPKGIYECKFCNRTCVDNTALRIHERVHTGERPYACSTCDKKFKNISTLGRHNRIHTGEKRYVCDKCNKSFTHKNSLTIHMRRHTGERPYICDYCSKQFSDNAGLTQHKFVHTKEKKYSCDQCDKSFSFKSTLNIHNRTHTGERPFLCNICSKTFRQRTHFQSHMNAHTGDRPYKCDKCFKTYTDRAGLRKHTLFSHSLRLAVNNVKSVVAYTATNT